MPEHTPKGEAGALAKCEDCGRNQPILCRTCSRENGEANFIVGYQTGAAVILGLLGMAEEIRKRATI